MSDDEDAAADGAVLPEISDDDSDEGVQDDNKRSENRRYINILINL